MPPASSSDCPHLDCVGEITKEELIQKSHGQCQDCEVGGPNLWACLENGCSYVGCGESHADHSTVHSQDTRHNLTVNLTTLRVWCYACAKEVFLERKLRPSSPNSGSSKALTSGFSSAQENSRSPDSPTSLRVPSSGVSEDLDMDTKEEEDPRTRGPSGLRGLKNIGNTCYMNAALQALSNCPPLTQFFLECGALVRTDKKPALCKSYQKLVSDLWLKNRNACVVPTSLFQGIKAINPMFRGYSQQDSQEFLRCLMDQLHEELKEPFPSRMTAPAPWTAAPRRTCAASLTISSPASPVAAAREPRTSCREEGQVDTNEAEMLIPEQEDIQANREWQKEKNMINDMYRASGPGGGTDADKDVDTTNETTPIISTQGRSKYRAASQVKAASDSFPDIQLSNNTVHPRPQSPVPMEAHKMSSSPPKSSGWPSLNPAHKKAMATFSPPKNKRQKKYRSVISDVFDGTIVSSVQCLTCDRVSVTLENFQDISLPIPGKEDLAKLHSASHQTALVKAGSCGEAYAPQGWIAFVMEYIKSWFWGPVVTLQDCLAAFFARDELKGDNMYSCEKCKKLRNGVKFCKMQSLPEFMCCSPSDLCIHLKRFRHELMFSTKIGTHVSFPLEGLDLQPFLAKDSSAQTTNYDLLSVICHHGTASSGHYIAYCRNDSNNLWYEFDDQSVNEVPESCVQNAEAYVLFYKRATKQSQLHRRPGGMLPQNVWDHLYSRYGGGPAVNHLYVCHTCQIEIEKLEKRRKNELDMFVRLNKAFQEEESPVVIYCISMHWFRVPPNKASFIDDLVVMLPQNVWDHLYSRYGGGPAVNHLYVCHTCQIEIEKLEKRRKNELDMFVRLNKAFQEEESPVVIYCISMHWFREWEGFVKGKDNDSPGPIDNSKIAVNKNGHLSLKQGADSGQISEETWNFLHSIYGGGPLLTVRPSVTHQESENSQSEEKIEVETRSL
ncbi:hypothetical protein WMY93_000607 [Mugilogobius chulae]|uniref:Ubiquitin carboxyl-terminal hydrolase n=1 Tax=Mugilogobius chulae TaxID=88201 RepID=A0AAW0Q5J4_9GOBI